MQVEGAAPQSRTQAEVLSGLNAAAVLTPSGEWEILQYQSAVQTGANTYELSLLLRGQSGTDGAIGAPTPAGARFVLLTPNLVRVDMALSERSLPLVWRAAPAGRPPSGAAMTEADFTWTASATALAPAHLAAAPASGGLLLSWIRRARIGGDGWDQEPPLSEEREAYLVEVLDGADVVRTAEADSAQFLYEDAMQAADFPSGLPDPLRVRVRPVVGDLWLGRAERPRPGDLRRRRGGLRAS
ncbi:MAG: hypothetical protein WDM92_07325 [Caulobacteraceae bacterium]